jgi:hypothetical protein
MNAFADQLFEAGSKSVASIMRLPIVSWKDGVLFFTVLSQQKKQIESVRKELIVFIRERFGVKSVTMDYEIVSTPVHEAKPFTGRQKLDAMIKANPEIINLIEKLQLDLED